MASRRPKQRADDTDLFGMALAAAGVTATSYFLADHIEPYVTKHRYHNSTAVFAGVRVGRAGKSLTLGAELQSSEQPCRDVSREKHP